jgi:tetratricopeptide (TPR) repeat protein/transcriptional regulator with XRE-family HTH domain
MNSFSEQLSYYIERTGISDSELARRLGVSRQTVFRWREGQSRGPRDRDDVLQLAKLLQLSPDEMDTLLLSAGFAPEESRSGSGAAQDASIEHDVEGPARWKTTQNTWLKPALLLSLIAFSVVVVAVLLVQFNVLSPFFTTEPRRASEGETLILVSEFTNFGSDLVGYNIAGRLIDAVRTEFEVAGMEDVRVERLPDTITSAQSAQSRGRELGATLVIWGEYDSGRVIAHASAPDSGTSEVTQGKEWFVSSVEELSTVINSELPQEIRWEVLFILGQAYYLSGDAESAQELFRLAIIESTEDKSNAGLVNFFLGLIESQNTDPDIDAVIAYYSEALSSKPNLASAYNNRGTAYLDRRDPGDLERAKDDFEQAIEIATTFDAAIHNLAITLVYLDPTSLEDPIKLLEKAMSINPDSPSSSHALCWYHSLDGRPEEALPYCDLAVSLNSSGLYSESRGVTLAMLGYVDDGISEMNSYLEYLRENDPDSFEVEGPIRLEWIRKLKEGINPFDEDTILQILQE